MPLSALALPQVDPSPLFEIYRGNHATELLAAAVGHFRLFGPLAEKSRTRVELQQILGLQTRPTIVLTTALCGMKLLRVDSAGLLHLTEMAREHLVPGLPFDVGDYVGLSAKSPGVLEMVERLRTNRPAGARADEAGAAFIYREGVASAMEHEASARHLTLALAGRAKNVAPALAQQLDLSGARRLVDVGGGTGIYSIALLQKNPQLEAIVLDRPEVLKVAQEFAEQYGVADRLHLQASDMFRDPLPSQVDVILLSNILHDWDVPECQQLIHQSASALKPGGRLLIHDVFLNDLLDGPLSIALYSAALFCLTEGRAYSEAEYRGWLIEAGLRPQPIIPTRIHCGVLAGVR